MTRPRTYFELNRLADIAKKRETAIATAKLTKTPKSYVERPTGGSAYFRSIESENLFVFMPIPVKAGSLLTNLPLIFGMTSAEVTAIANSSKVGFKGNHKSILRIRFTRLKSTPTTKVTSWGTRVVDHVDDSITVPFGVDATGSVKATITAFGTTMANSTVGALLGTKKGSYAELIYNGKVLSKFVKPS